LLDLFEPRLRRDALAADRGRFAISAERRGVLSFVLAIVGLGRRRSSGVVVAMSYTPWKSGWPSAVRRPTAAAPAGAAFAGL
jgi:hypothetical protein